MDIKINREVYRDKVYACWVGKNIGGTMEDGKIIELFYLRDQAAIAETDKKYGPKCRGVAQNILSSREDSEECLNDTYLKVWQSVPPVRPRNLRTYLSKIIRNNAVDRYDEGHRQKRVPADACDPLDDFDHIIGSYNIDDEIEAKRIGRIINSYLESLADRSLYIFMSRFYYAMPLSDIAHRLGVSTSTVNKELAAMKNELKEKLTDGGIDL